MSRRPELRIRPARSLAAAALAGAIALALPACGGSEEPAAPNAATSARGTAPGAEVPAAGTAPRPGKAPRRSAEAAPPQPPSPPADFELPGDLPGYPGAELVEVTNDEPAVLSVTYETRDDPEVVAQHYYEELRTRDWIVTQTPDPDGQALWAEKGSRSLTTVISKTGRGSQITHFMLREGER